MTTDRIQQFLSHTEEGGAEQVICMSAERPVILQDFAGSGQRCSGEALERSVNAIHPKK